MMVYQHLQRRAGEATDFALRARNMRIACAKRNFVAEFPSDSTSVCAEAKPTGALGDCEHGCADTAHICSGHSPVGQEQRAICLCRLKAEEPAQEWLRRVRLQTFQKFSRLLRSLKDDDVSWEVSPKSEILYSHRTGRKRIHHLGCRGQL